MSGCQEHKTLILSLPAEFKCAGREKHETEIRWLEIEWQKHTIPIEKSSEIGWSGRVRAHKGVPLKAKSTPREPRDHEWSETREHATSDITVWTTKPEKQRFWYEFYCGKWKPEKHESCINETNEKQPSILTQYLQVFSRLLWKSPRTQITHKSTQKSKWRFWYDFYCGDFQKWTFRTKFFHEMSGSIRRKYNFWVEKRVTTTKTSFAGRHKPPQSDVKI